MRSVYSLSSQMVPPSFGALGPGPYARKWDIADIINGREKGPACRRPFFIRGRLINFSEILGHRLPLFPGELAERFSDLVEDAFFDLGAGENGRTVGICLPKRESLSALAMHIGLADAFGVRFVFVSEIVD